MPLLQVTITKLNPHLHQDLNNHYQYSKLNFHAILCVSLYDGTKDMFHDVNKPQSFASLPLKPNDQKKT
jgi:hypothetical protein